MTPSSISDYQTERAVARLTEAVLLRVPCLPVRDLIAQDEVAAYAVQRAGIARRVADGARVVGHKIGLTSPAVQQQLGVDQPDFGVLLDEMAHADGTAVPIDLFLQPRVEAEVAFVLAQDLAEGDLDLDQIRAAIDHVVAALEICDSRIINWDITFGDTVADNASAGAFVLGAERRTLDEVEPRAVTMSMTATGEEDSAGTGTACLGDPLLALQWLARRARDLGEPLRAGQIILSGALGPMRRVHPEAAVTASITGLGTVTCTFTKEKS